MACRYILVTGANKGIGLAIVIKCLESYDDTHMIMACRSLERGQIARQDIIKNNNQSYENRITVIEMDTSKDVSVKAAATQIKEEIFNNNNNKKDDNNNNNNSKFLYGIVNNAGIASGTLSDVFEVNTFGPKRVCDNFIPMLLDKENGGRIVNMSSAAATYCVSECTTLERKQFFTNPNITWEEINQFMNDLLQESCNNNNNNFESYGLGKPSFTTGPYSISKALLNCYTMALAKEYPNLKINSCTPGMIATDIFSSAIPWYIPIPSWLIKLIMTKLMNAKSPEEGTVSTMYLLFSDDDNLQGNGWYYGSDGKRSPLDEYRSPGSPPYDGP